MTLRASGLVFVCKLCSSLKHISFRSYIAEGGKVCLELGVGLYFALIALAGVPMCSGVPLCNGVPMRNRVPMCNAVRLVCARNPETRSDQLRIG